MAIFKQARKLISDLLPNMYYTLTKKNITIARQRKTTTADTAIAIMLVLFKLELDVGESVPIKPVLKDALVG